METAFIPHLVGGADIAGLLNNTNAWSLVDAGEDLVLDANKRLAVLRKTTGPAGYEDQFPGSHWVLLVNLTGGEIEQPVLGFGSQGYVSALIDGGLRKNPAFGGRGPTTRSSLPPYAVYATLVPATETTVNVGFTIDGAAIRTSLPWSDSETVYVSAGEVVGRERTSPVDHPEPSMTDHVYLGEPVALQFTGELMVNTEPEGASWSIVGQPQTYPGGGVAQQVPLGGQVIRFHEFPGWIPPRDQSVRITPGDIVEIEAVYTAAPSYELSGAGTWDDAGIATQRVHAGTVLGFWIQNQHGDIDPNATVSYLEGMTPPHGTLSLQNGWFSYRPAADDRLPFQVVISGGGRSQVVTIDPRPETISEETVINLAIGTELPDPSHGEFRSVVQTTGSTAQKKRFVISGQHVVLKADENDEIWSKIAYGEDEQNDAPEEVAIYADRVSVESELNLWGGNLTIYARQLVFPTREGRFINGGDVTLECLEITGPQLDIGRIELDGDLTTSFPTGELEALVRGGTIVESSRELPAAYRWLHPLALRHTQTYVDRLYYLGFYPEAREMLHDYVTWLEEVEAREEPIGNLPDFVDPQMPDKTRLAFGQIALEMRPMLRRLEDNLDYFGNPAGWTPMLSFETVYSLAENEIKPFMDAHYLSYWLGKKAEDLVAARQALQDAKSDLIDENKELDTEFKELKGTEAQPGKLELLRQDARSLDRQISKLQDDIAKANERLERRAEDNVRANQENVPFWKQGLRSLATIAEVIPVYQPGLAAVGSSLDLVSRVDEQEPLESILEGTNIAASYAADSYDSEAEELKETLAAAQQKDGDGKEDELKPSDLTERAGHIRDATKVFNTSVGEIQSLLEEDEVSESEIRDELMRLRAEDPQLAAFANRLEVTNANKVRFAQKLAQLESRVAEIPGIVQANLLGIRSIRQSLDDHAGVVTPQVRAYLKASEVRAKNRLRKYLYWLAKSYEYRFLDSYSNATNGPKDLFATFDALERLADASLGQEGGHRIDDFGSLHSVFQEELSTLADSILTNTVEGGAIETTKEYPVVLNQKQITELNANGHTFLNLVEENYLPADREQFRIVEIKVSAVDYDLPGGAPRWGPESKVDFEIVHGTNRVDEKPQAVSMTRDGNTYLFNPRRENQHPRVWSSTLGLDQDEFRYAAPSGAQQSLLKELIPGENIDRMDYSRPSAGANLKISRQLSQTGTSLEFTNVVLTVWIDSVPKDQQISEVEVRFLQSGVLDNSGLIDERQNPRISPRIWVDREDLNGRRDGNGRLVRRYHEGSQETSFSAEERYGQWEFVCWRRPRDDGRWEVYTERGWRIEEEILGLGLEMPETATLGHGRPQGFDSLHHRVYAEYRDLADRTPPELETFEKVRSHNGVDRYELTFDEDVVLVDRDDFHFGVDEHGNPIRGGIMAVTGSGRTWWVTVDSRVAHPLTLWDQDRIVDVDGNALAGEGESEQEGSSDLLREFRMGIVGKKADGSFELFIDGPAGESVDLQASADLKNWSTVETIQVPVGGINYLDEGAIGKRTRYWRLVRP